MAKKDRMAALEQIKELDAFKVSEIKNPARVCSMLDHPTTISYKGEALVIPPKARGKKAPLVDFKMLGACPRGIVVVKL